MQLRDISIFKNLTDEDLNLLRKKSEFIEKTYKKGEYIFRRGDISADFYYLIKGKISVFQIDSRGNRSIFQVFKKPTVFGEVYPYLKNPYDYDAVCEEDSKILIIKDFKKLFSPPTSEDFLKSYISFLSKKCLKLSRKNQISSQASLRQKISKLILDGEKNGIFKLTMTREKMADYLSTSRPSLSRKLREMEKEGLIEIRSDYIKIIDKNSLFI